MALMDYDDIAEYARQPVREGLAKSASAPRVASVFLSHSWRDRAHLDGVIRFFGMLSAPVYVDELDGELPAAVSEETADVLATRIEQCPRLVVLVSPASRQSRWIPWELGLAHGLKGVARVATLPISDRASANEEEWTQNEYLGMYPRIRWATLKDKSKQWIVTDPRDGRSWRLSYWLTSETIS